MVDDVQNYSALKLKQLPIEILEMQNYIEDLNLNNNEFAEFPLDILKLPKLIILRIANNKIAEIPQSIDKLTYLK